MIYAYEIDNDATGELVINDDLLCDEAAAECRAMSEFADKGYHKHRINLSTYITAIHVGGRLQLAGNEYKVVSVRTSLQNGEAVSMIGGTRIEI